MYKDKFQKHPTHYFSLGYTNEDGKVNSNQTLDGIKYKFFCKFHTKSVQPKIEINNKANMFEVSSEADHYNFKYDRTINDSLKFTSNFTFDKKNNLEIFKSLSMGIKSSNYGNFSLKILKKIDNEKEGKEEKENASLDLNKDMIISENQLNLKEFKKIKKNSPNYKTESYESKLKYSMKLNKKYYLNSTLDYNKFDLSLKSSHNFWGKRFSFFHYNCFLLKRMKSKNLTFSTKNSIGCSYKFMQEDKKLSKDIYGGIILNNTKLNSINIGLDWTLFNIFKVGCFTSINPNTIIKELEKCEGNQNTMKTLSRNIKPHLLIEYSNSYRNNLLQNIEAKLKFHSDNLKFYAKFSLNKKVLPMKFYLNVNKDDIFNQSRKHFKWGFGINYHI